MTLDTPLSDLAFLPQLRARQLARFGLPTVGALLEHFPRRYEDRRQFDKFPGDTTEQAVCVCGTVKATQPRRIRGWQKMFDVLIEEPGAHALGGRLVLRWFNSHWVEKMFAIGQQVVVFGKPKRSGQHIVIAHPDFEVVENDADQSIHLRRIAPIHSATEGITPRYLRWLVWKVLDGLRDDAIPQLLPPKLDATPRAWALRQMHFPESFEAQEKARRHFVLEEFFAMQLAASARRSEARSQPGAPHCGPGELTRRLHTSLPFPLTGAQQRAIAEIRDDLASSRPMNRLLHGDVGSGKTLVAMSAMLHCVEAGFQAALMAPTQILAEQHYLNFRRFLDPLGIRVALRTGARREQSGPLPLFSKPTEPRDGTQAGGSTRGPRVGSGGPPEPSSQSEPDSRREPPSDLHSDGSPVGEIVPAGRRDQHAGRVCYPSFNTPPDDPQIFIGTHALLYEGAGFSRLGLAVIDEQHKFGVMQRARLREQAGGIAPDVLVMTATPIPRTLTMTLYGDLDVSVLDELPAGRGKIVTGIRPPSKLPDAAKFIRSEIEAGRQSYIVYPLVEESEKLEAKAATAEFEKWRELLAPHRCELIHGRLAPEEKDAAMERFRSGEAKCLVATTVIEVGVDVPNATVMLVENAERFGLAQLHQLRGRIGRGAHKSYCVLITSDESREAIAKLQVLVDTTDGFRVAEEDLRQRGWGDMLGTAQAGNVGFRVGDPVRELDLMKLARNHAWLTAESDPHLERPEHAGARALLAASAMKKPELSQVS